MIQGLKKNNLYQYHHRKNCLKCAFTVLLSVIEKKMGVIL